MIPLDWPTPNPNTWSAIYEIMFQRHTAICTSSELPPRRPLILAGAAVSTETEIRSRWQEHISWANSHGCSVEILEFLGTRPDDDFASKLAGVHGRSCEKEWWEDLGEEEHV